MTTLVKPVKEKVKSEEDIVIKSRPIFAISIIAVGIILILIGMVTSISTGAAGISFSVVLDAVFHFNPSLEQHQIVYNLRFPRALTGALIGAGFAVSGAIMQGMTRNPLADTGLLGINAGARFVLVVVFAFYPNMEFKYLILFSFIGAGLGVGLIYAIAYFAKGGLTPLRLVLAGAIIGSLVKGITQIISLVSGVSYELAFWSAGGISAVEWFQVKVIIPWITIGLLGAIAISPKLTILSLGEEVAIGLGQGTKVIKALAAVVVLLLVGASVSTVGGVGFIGLIVPHIVRFLVGVDYRLIIPCSAVVGAVIVVIADIGAKLINMPYETPLGSIMAVLGVPFFLYLARKEKRELI
ncbi:FecCD family ABC transporter permease [Paraliobacillus zengyii]|uniref:FecCD family ABC transporter permease n=1 Tax=Paraliobacillus zengyii TaxID=2213194 RepID=UPI000DD4576C|nr:iron ABC transporter permease [Paraliobacillus zengyii]